MSNQNSEPEVRVGKKTRNTNHYVRLEGVWGTQPSLSGGLGASAPRLGFQPIQHLAPQSSTLRIPRYNSQQTLNDANP